MGYYKLSNDIETKQHYDLITSGIDMNKAFILIMCMKSIPYINEQGETCFRNVVKRRFIKNYDEFKDFYAVVNEEIPNPNTYISVNTFFIPKSTNTAIHRFSFLFVDIDCHTENTSVSEHDLDGLYIHLCEEYFGQSIPVPSLIVSSGRGLHLYWKLKPLGYSQKNIRHWNKIQKNILEVMESLNYTIVDPDGIEDKVFKVDKAVKNASRVLRLAGTFNSKAKRFTDIVDINTNVYTLTEINQEYLIPTIKHKIATRKPKGKKAVGRHKSKGRALCSPKKQTAYTIHEEQQLLNSRLSDLQVLIKIRGGRMTSYRGLVLWQIHNILLQLCYTQPERESFLNNINNSFTEPVPQSQVESVLNQTQIYRKLETRFIIEILDITPEEQDNLITLVDTTIKTQRYQEKQKSNRKLQKQQRLEQRLQKVSVMASENFTQAEISKELNLSIRTIKECYKTLGISKQKTSNKDAVFTLKLQGYTQSEVAEKLNISIRTVRKYWNIGV